MAVKKLEMLINAGTELGKFIDEKTTSIANVIDDRNAQKAALLAAGGGAALAPQEAEAGPVAEAIFIGQRLLDLGFLKTNTPQALKTAETKYRAAMKNSKAFAERERRAYAGDYLTEFVDADLPPATELNLESLLDTVITPVRGDLSSIGKLKKVGGIDVDVDVQGGFKFPQQHQDNNLGWASNEGVANSQHNKFITAGKLEEKPVTAIYNGMGRNSVNFSTSPADGLMQQVSLLSPIAKADIVKFDKELRAIKTTSKNKKTGKVTTKYPYKDWVGLDHPDAMNQLIGENGFPKRGKMRTVFSNIMSKAEYRDRGFPSYPELIKAVTDRDIANINVGDAGASAYRVDATQGTVPIDVHKSYDTAMPGQYVGGMDSVPFEVMFPQTYNKMGELRTKAGKPYTHDQKIVASNIRGDGYEVTNDDWLKGIEKYKRETGNADPRLLGAIGIGSGTVVGSLFSGDADAGPINIVDPITGAIRKGIEAYHGTPARFPPTPNNPLGEFDDAFMGTGEGAQAYGYGHYQADSDNVSEGYRQAGKMFTPADGSTATYPAYKGVGWYQSEADELGKKALSYFDDLKAYADNDPRAAARMIRETYEAPTSPKDQAMLDELFADDPLGLLKDPVDLDYVPEELQIAKWLEDNADDISIDKVGSLYRSEIDIDPDTMLDWYKPLSEQSDSVKSALAPYIDSEGRFMAGNRVIDNPTGEQIYYNVVPDATDPAVATARMQELGVPGVRYLDGNSRSADNPTSNYVVFDPTKINIKERGAASPAALAATAAAGGAGMAMMSQDANAGMASIPPALDLRNIPFTNQPTIPRAEEAMAADVNAQLAEMKSKGNAFSGMTEKNNPIFDNLRQDAMSVLRGANRAIGQAGTFIGEAAAIPVSGILGLTGAASELAQGNGIDAALQRGAEEVNKPMAQQFNDVGLPLVDAGSRSLFSMGGAVVDAAQGESPRTIINNMGQAINTDSGEQANRLGEYVTDELTAVGLPPRAAAGAGALAFGGSQLISPL